MRIQRFRHVSLICSVAAALALGAGVARAGDTDLGSYFKHLQAAEAYKARKAHRAQQAAAARPARRLRRVNIASFSRVPMDIPTLERTVFTRINLYRMAKGLRPLTAKSNLAAVARRKSVGMANGTAPFSHDGMRDRLMPFLGGFFGYHAGGEILAYNRGAADPARTAMVSWIRSPTHKEIIEDDFTRMGVGAARSSDGRYYFTVLFLR